MNREGREVRVDGERVVFERREVGGERWDASGDVCPEHQTGFYQANEVHGSHDCLNNPGTC